MTDISHKDALALADVIVSTPSVAHTYKALKAATRERDAFVADITSRYDENTVVEPNPNNDPSRQALVINKNGKEIVVNLSIADSNKINDIDERNAEATEKANHNYNSALSLVIDKSPAGKKLNEYLGQSEQELNNLYKDLYPFVESQNKLKVSVEELEKGNDKNKAEKVKGLNAEISKLDGEITKLNAPISDYIKSHPEIFLEERSEVNYQKSQAGGKTASLGDLQAPSVAANLDKSEDIGRTA